MPTGDELRTLMRRFPAGVAVVTVDGSGNSLAKRIGCTIDIENVQQEAIVRASGGLSARERRVRLKVLDLRRDRILDDLEANGKELTAVLSQPCLSSRRTGAG